MNILVIKHGAFGDFVQALGAMRAIRLHHPHDKIMLLTTRPFLELARASGYFDGVHADTRPRWYDMRGWWRLRRWIRGWDFARIYDLQNSERSATYRKLFRGTPEWSGIAKGASHAIADNAARKSKHVFDALADQLAVAGIGGVVPDNLAWINAAVAHFNLPARYVLMVPGCSVAHPEKRWPQERYGEIALWLAAKGCTPVLLGTGDEMDVTAFIKGVCPQALDLTGQTTLFQIAALARGAVAAIGNDTGPMQMIGPTGCKTVGLYAGRANPIRHRPLGPHVVVIHKNEIAAITVDDVQDALQAFL